MPTHPFVVWLNRALAAGESVQDHAPEPPADPAPVAARLRAAFDRHALDVAGPPLPFDPQVAVASAVLLAHACWRQAAGEAGPELHLPEPAGPAAHLSADVCLRLLPGVHRRANGTNLPLAEAIAAVGRRWPLLGVLLDLDGTPDAPPGFGHPGLDLLYAERLVLAPRAGWVPPPGPARDVAERVFARHALALPTHEAADD